MIIGPNAVILGYVLRSIPNSDFSMGDFGGRLRLQKIIYLVEAFGVYLGYGFSWYLRGPYCTSLTRAGLELEQVASEIPDNARAQFLRKAARERFDRCVRFIGSIMDGPNDLDRLEIAASVHLLAKDSALSKKDIFGRIVSKMPQGHTSREQLGRHCDDMWDRLVGHSLVSDDARDPGPAQRQAGGAQGSGYRVTEVPEHMDRIMGAMTDYQQYGDVALAVTMKDIHDSRQELRANSPPAFMHRPNEVEQLAPDPDLDGLITRVLRQYG